MDISVKSTRLLFLIAAVSAIFAITPGFAEEITLTTIMPAGAMSAGGSAVASSSAQYNPGGTQGDYCFTGSSGTYFFSPGTPHGITASYPSIKGSAVACPYTGSGVGWYCVTGSSGTYFFSPYTPHGITASYPSIIGSAVVCPINSSGAGDFCVTGPSGTYFFSPGPPHIIRASYPSVK